MARHLPAAQNDGYVYLDRVSPARAGVTVLDYYAARHPRRDRDRWRERIDAGLVDRNGRADRGHRSRGGR